MLKLSDEASGLEASRSILKIGGGASGLEASRSILRIGGGASGRKASRSILIVTICLAAVSLSANAVPKAHVLVRPASEVAGAQVSLGDIATVQCGENALAERLKSVPVCPSPLAGKTRTLTRDQILIAMRKQGAADSAELLSPDRVVVRRSATVVTGQALFETARQYAEESGKWPGTTAVEPVRLPADQSVSAGVLELRVSNRAGRLRCGRNSVPVETVVDGSVYSTTQVSIVVRAFAPVRIATEAIPKSAEITGANTRTEQREITNLPADILLRDLPGIMTAAVPISKDAVLRESWVCAPPAIRSGDNVTVVVTGGLVCVTDKGVAASDGRVGDRLKVRMGDAREIRGTVAGPGVVEIQIDRRS